MRDENKPLLFVRLTKKSAQLTIGVIKICAIEMHRSYPARCPVISFDGWLTTTTTTTGNVESHL